MSLDLAPFVSGTSSINLSIECSNRLEPANLILLEEIGKSKASVFLAHLVSQDRYVAVKVFQRKHKKISRYFSNEIKFSHLEHPNIISILEYSSQQKINLSENLSLDVSLIMMELAPYGDFYNLLITEKILLDEKLTRTYFHQLIDAVEYMHKNGVAHQDLKLDNLLLGEDFQLKVSDFDAAWTADLASPLNTGTLYYRAPEVLSKKCEDPKMADIYSAGILLFMFKCGGMLPHTEAQLYNGVDLQNLLYNNNDKFWKEHCQIQERSTSFFDQDFRSLFNGMTAADPAKRYTIEQIKSSKWYQGEIYTKDEVISMMQ